jgi:hypothetical protein
LTGITCDVILELAIADGVEHLVTPAQHLESVK